MSYQQRQLNLVRTGEKPSAWSQDTLYFVTLGNPAQTDPLQPDFPHVELYITDGIGTPTPLTNNQLIDGRYLAFLAPPLN